MKRILLCIAALLPAFATPCYNDRDTLGYELENKPDVQKALTGRFDRFPPLYYSMRVDRLRAKKKLTPDEYDDLSVALDRLGKSDEALKVIAEKGHLPNLSKIERYRFYANRGTIRAHRGLRHPSSSAGTSELKSAAEDIAEALRINPGAHFGRAGTQLEVIRWIIAVREFPANLSDLGLWLSQRMDSDVDVPTSLAGLIMLGAAWESPDAAFAIATIDAASEELTGTAELALARYDELLAAGRVPFLPKANAAAAEDFPMMLGKKAPLGEPPVKVRFAALRKEADQWQAAKTAYMMARLKLGRHPDTDPRFWSEWKETAMPRLPVKPPAIYSLEARTAFWTGALVCVLMILRAVRRRRRASTLGRTTAR